MKLKVHCNAHKKLPVDHILRQLNPAHVLQFSLSLLVPQSSKSFLLLRVLLHTNHTIFTASCGHA